MKRRRAAGPAERFLHLRQGRRSRPQPEGAKNKIEFLIKKHLLYIEKQQLEKMPKSGYRLLYPNNGFKVEEKTDVITDDNNIVVQTKKVFESEKDYKKFLRRREKNNKAAAKSRKERKEKAEAVVDNLKKSLEKSEEDVSNLKNDLKLANLKIECLQRMLKIYQEKIPETKDTQHRTIDVSYWIEGEFFKCS